ncbi:MAG: DUF5668 domain-containing protein [Anaerolineales bacterium]|jgi:hypothetical protein
MSEDNQSKKRRGSLFFPLLLIAIGLILLLTTLGVIHGDIWSYIWMFWPVLLIIIGLDGYYKRENYVTSTLFNGLGIIFLMANLGYLPVDVWRMIISLWPILLIALGFDILFGRRSIWASLFGSLVILAILAGSIWWFGYRDANLQISGGQEIYEPLSDTTQAEIRVEPGMGLLQLDALSDSNALIEGMAHSGERINITKNVTHEGGTTTVVISTSGSTTIFPFSGQGGRWVWDLSVTPDIPLKLGSDMSVGDSNLTLTNLQISDLNVNMGIGKTTIALPQEGRVLAWVDGGIGQITIIVPDSMALRIYSDTGIASLSVPDSFVKAEGGYTSPDYNSADHRTDLRLDLAIGGVIVREER